MGPRLSFISVKSNNKFELVGYIFHFPLTVATLFLQKYPFAICRKSKVVRKNQIQKRFSSQFEKHCPQVSQSVTPAPSDPPGRSLLGLVACPAHTSAHSLSSRQWLRGRTKKSSPFCITQEQGYHFVPLPLQRLEFLLKSFSFPPVPCSVAVPLQLFLGASDLL